MYAEPPRAIVIRPVGVLRQRPRSHGKGRRIERNAGWRALAGPVVRPLLKNTGNRSDRGHRLVARVER